MRLKGPQLATRTQFSNGRIYSRTSGSRWRNAIRMLHANAPTGASVSVNTAISCLNAYPHLNAKPVAAKGPATLRGSVGAAPLVMLGA
jgi:hypothetical protein